MAGPVIRVKLVPEGRVVEVEASEMRVSELLKRLGYARESAVVLVGGRPVVEDEVVRAGSEVVVVRVLSGG